MPDFNIPIEELRKKKLFIGTPMYGGMSAGMYTRSMCDLSTLCTHWQIPVALYFLFNESLITRARNYVCDEFMRSDATHLMFIDADIGFNAQDVVLMMGLMTEESPYDILGGPYPKKCISWEKIKIAVDKGFADSNANDLEKYVGDYVFNPKGGMTSIPIQQPAEVLELGTGFMMIKKSAMQKFADAFPQYLYRPDHVRTEHFDGKRKIMQYFQAEIDGLDFVSEYKKLLLSIQSGEMNPQHIAEEMKRLDALADKKSLRYLSEDYWFSQKAQEIGLRAWLCPWMKTQHLGSYIFGGSLIDLAQIGAPATADPSMLGDRKGK